MPSTASQTGGPQPGGPGMRPRRPAGTTTPGGAKPGGNAARMSPGPAPMPARVGDPGARVKYTGATNPAPVKTKLVGHMSSPITSSGGGSARPSAGFGGGPQPA